MKKQELISEEKLLKQLDIPDWRHMSKDKIVTFASQLPYLDPEVAKAAIAQFPNFRDFSKDIVRTMNDNLVLVCNEGGKSTKRAYDLNEAIIKSLDNRLKKPFLFPKEREKIIEAMLEISKNIDQIDKTNKNFLASSMRNVCALGAGVVVLGAAAVGVVIRRT